jgi:hypothetical protein
MKRKRSCLYTVSKGKIILIRKGKGKERETYREQGFHSNNGFTKRKGRRIQKMLNEDYIKKGKTDLLSTALIEDLSDKNLFDPIFCNLR